MCYDQIFTPNGRTNFSRRKRVAACFVFLQLLEEITEMNLESAGGRGEGRGSEESGKQLTDKFIIDYHTRGQTGKTIINYHEEFEHAESE